MTTPLELVAFALVGFGLWLGLMRTEPGRRLRGRISRNASNASAAASGEPQPELGTTTNEDHVFLLARCGGDEAELLRRLETETRRNPSLNEAELYRKAIRSWFVEKRGGTHGAIAEDLDETWL